MNSQKKPDQPVSFLARVVIKVIVMGVMNTHLLPSVIIEITRLNTEYAHLQEERNELKGNLEKMSQKAGSLVSHSDLSLSNKHIYTHI